MKQYEIQVIKRDSIKKYDAVGYFVKDSWFVIEEPDGGRKFIPNNVEWIAVPKKWLEDR